MITRRLEFDAGHRLMNHEGKCKHIHGHRYVVYIKVEAIALDEIGREIDFGVIKEKVGNWIDKHLDHQLILNENETAEVLAIAKWSKVYFMETNPTAENLAILLYNAARKLLPADLEIKEVEIWETPNCSATYRGGLI